MKSNDALKSVLLMATAVVLVGGGLVYWQYTARTEAEARVASIQAELPDPAELETKLNDVQAKLEESGARLQHLEKSLPNVAYVPTLLKELETVGEQNQLSITGVRPIFNTGAPVEETPPDATFTELQIDITGQGTYRAVMDMVAALRTFPKIISVENLALAPRQDLQNRSRELDATIRLRAFVFKEPIVDPNAAIPGAETSPDRAVEPNTANPAAPSPNTSVQTPRQGAAL